MDFFCITEHMVIKHYIAQSILIYLALGFYLSAFSLTLLAREKSGRRFYLAGFLFAFAAFVYRWHSVRHVPMQNMFEIFLTMAVIIYPLSFLCRRFFAVEGGSQTLLSRLACPGQAFDMLLAAVLLIVVGFILSGRPGQLPPALQSRLFIPHVSAYLLGYIIMAKAAVQAFCQLKHGVRKTEISQRFEENTYTMVCLGFPLLTLGLILGACWGKLAWGNWWNWDPKELWSLACWLIYAGYLHFRFIYGKKHPCINSLWVICGTAAILLTLLWVNLSRIFGGLHTYAV